MAVRWRGLIAMMARTQLTRDCQTPDIPNPPPTNHRARTSATASASAGARGCARKNGCVGDADHAIDRESDRASGRAIDDDDDGDDGGGGGGGGGSARARAWRAPRTLTPHLTPRAPRTPRTPLRPQERASERRIARLGPSKPTNLQ